MSRASGHRQELQAIARQAMVERGLQPDFAPAALAETAAFHDAAHAPDARDLRDLLWCSIDNDDSRDLDQLSATEPRADGAARVLVAIADVDALVRAGSAVDDHARQNTTSVYTAAEIFPMLPPRLSTDLTSLNANEDRVAMVVEMTIDRHGDVAEPVVGRALVRNRAKLAYDGVAAWLEGGGTPAALAAVPGLDAALRLQDAVAQALRRVRGEHGALGLQTLETRPVFRGDVLTDLRPEEPNRARQLIEELMIAANGVTARALAARGFPSMRRVLRSPERWGRLVDLAGSLGDTLPPEPDSGALEAFLARRRHADPDGFPDLSLAVVKLLGSGAYEIDVPGDTPTGHFGLAVTDYTHSTAPNRRYPDLLTQRLLKAAVAGASVPYRGDELTGLARHCTEQEDNAKKVERQVRKSAAALLLQPRIGQTFDAIVTGASAKGTWVRIVAPRSEGKLVHGFAGLDVGDRLQVRLVATDVARGYIDFVRAGTPRPLRRQP